MKLQWLYLYIINVPWFIQALPIGKVLNFRQKDSHDIWAKSKSALSKCTECACGSLRTKPCGGLLNQGPGVEFGLSTQNMTGYVTKPLFDAYMHNKGRNFHDYFEILYFTTPNFNFTS